MAAIAKKIVILVLILAVPGFLYYLLTAKGKNRYKPLAIYGQKIVAKTGHKFHGKYIPDTIYHHLPAFTLTTQDGKQVSDSTFKGKIFVAGFFYTHCPAVCSTINRNMSYLVDTYRKNKMVYFTSITVDPQRDSVSVLKKYADSFKPASKRWLFLTGDTTSIYSLARQGFLVNALKESDDDFIYSDNLVLIDAEKRIRGYYKGANTNDINRLTDEIKVLIAEELRKVDKPLY
ncbi:SCO family protein [Mucilaginibacter sp. SG564]|uniref:SCO family protein n=1 Tax=unclassified Mucilaginibacter TaxID=2617802 RepID=UPI001553DF1E|nr:SCO family protein [Mucilaginibacter sp. SG564]NOW96176.1 protein SCO1/2 [Mucilaginibacter sp. SG564]